MTYHDTAVGLAGTVALCVFAAGASAETVDLTYKGPSAPNDKKSVTITSTPSSTDPSRNVDSVSGNVGAYGFEMKATDPDTGTSLGNFMAWCLDIQNELGQGQSFEYETTDTPFSNSFGLSTNERGRVQAVFDANYGGLNASDGLQAAGFQVALWDALYDDGTDAGDGAFAISGDQDIIDKANTFLTAANDYDGNKAFNLTFFESTGDSQRQNLVTASPVPLPASVLLLLGGLGGLGSLSALRRRTRTA